MRYTQPQGGPYPLDQTSDLLAGGTLMALVLGSNQGFNLANGTANTISGAVTSRASPSGVGAYNSGTAGDIGVANVSTGGSLVVHFWHGYYFSGGPTNAYLFGDYNGSSGVGLAGRHSNAAGRWGWFNGSSVDDGGETLTNGSLQTFVLVRDTVSGTIAIYRNGVLKITVAGGTGFANTMAFGSIGPNQYATFGCESNTLLTGRIRFKAWNAAQVARFTANPWQLFRSPQRVMLAAAGGTNTPINPGVGALALTGYSPAVAQSANQSLTPGAGSIGITGYAPSISQPQAITAGAGALTLTGYAPTVTQGITTSIVPGAGALNLTGYAPSIAQSANQSVMPDAGSLSISGYVPAITQTANQSIAPVQGSLTLTGYAPTVAQALASPNLVPDVGVLSITGYAPTVEQSAPITKIGGDDAPRHDEEDERVEVWEKRAPTPRRDDSLDKVIREAYAKAIGKPAAPAVAKAEPKPAALDEPVFDVDEEDDLEVLLLSL